MIPKRDVDPGEILAILDRPPHERPFIQFTLREEVRIRSIVAALEASMTVDQRLILVNVLGMYPPAKSADAALIRLLPNRNVEVRHAAADTLGKLRTTRGGAAMLDRLGIERSSRVRGMLLAGVGAAGAEGALPTLLRALTATTPLERQGAAWALGELGRGEALSALVARYEEEPDAWVRGTVADAISKLSELVRQDGR